jgi:RNA polymerase sigma-70 factor, ECF subfamily
MFFTFHIDLRLIYRMQQNLAIKPEIIEKCREGSLHDFRKLVEQSLPFAFAAAFRILGNYDDSEDIAQETMITLWKTIKKIRSADSFTPWLYRIVVNKCYDKLRKMKKDPEFTTNETTWSLLSNRIFETPGTKLENDEISKIITLLTNKLSPKQQTVFVLSEFEEMTSDEISFITGMSKMNIKANLHFARKRIGEMIEKYL